MEFKDKLKALRKTKGLTQSQLAEAIFVSRSTVAKWENGLGLPGPESMKLLEEYFRVQTADIATSEPEAVILQKNRRLRLIGQIAGWSLLFLAVAAISALPFAIQSGDYGLTWDMAAGVFADGAYIDTGDYRIYYFQFEGDLEDGRHWSNLQGWKPVQKHFWGFTVSEEDYAYRIVTKDNYLVGRLYSIQGKNGYYNLISKAGIYGAPEQPGEPMIWDIPGELITAASVTINGTEYQLQQGFFFITPEPVEYFKIGDIFLNVE